MSSETPYDSCPESAFCRRSTLWKYPHVPHFPGSSLTLKARPSSCRGETWLPLPCHLVYLSQLFLGQPPGRTQEFPDVPSITPVRSWNFVTLRARCDLCSPLNVSEAGTQHVGWC